MKKILSMPELLRENAPSLHGLFRSSDLAHLWGIPKGSTLQGRIGMMLEQGQLLRIQRDLYGLPNADLKAVALRLFPDGYFSLTTALSMHRMIGTRPMNLVEVLTPRPRPKSLDTPLGGVRMYVLNADYHFGYGTLDGYPVATPEKAYLDTCYFYLRKARYLFALGEDVDVAGLNRDKLDEMLQRYRNPKFRAFVKNLLDSHGP